METVLKAISDWIKSLLTAAIMSNLSGLFDDVNSQVGSIAQQVGTKPSNFEPRVFAMIEALSRNVVLPVAGILLTFIACYELIQLITEHNNMASFEPALIMKWIFKTAISVWLILKNALDLYHGKVLSSADGEHWLIQFATKYHLSYMSAVSELLKQLDSLRSYDLLNQYAMKSLTIAPDNPKAYCWLIRSLKAQGMNELATNELAAAKEHLTTEEYEEILAFGVNW